MESLPTKIGEKDIGEIVGMVNQVIEMKKCNPKKVAIIGGSYGGFVAGIAASRCSDIFKCAVLLNPVLNFTSFLNIMSILIKI